MKFLPILLLATVLGGPAYAHHRSKHVINRYDYIAEKDWSTCTKELVSVTVYSDGSQMKDFRRLPWHRCINRHNGGYHRHSHSYTPRPVPTERKQSKTDDNSCIEGSVIGGIAGGGLGAALSRGDGRWWAIPTGIVGGALAGCQIDGG
ncbi:hypothetical protein Syn7803C72_2 [Synechococcus phage ACG-2014d]|jgi:hypothetical protein|uniref:Uncharacterized protein n=1 Tax=Synechococcus phage ACG-2014d TaxID=1493509 RepID=A0A0E3FAE9_9CAUD|nr:cAMP phosphodiesterase [Synechococcus phage ACG-2014d]YP_010355171.1 cAMP phosphodiesterase [Synechococcus phage ACG-2014d]AIX14613.1 hypothetical protein Syn7803C45_2 [Synechococcus phage ACG-2014d]AIX14833.1 hypothetical protein Syn7803C46_2 [Synechococcus phage ACG-2014d]AIX15260.1 hypothetical protein Syn7803C48_2 [Synechococcus phage ACG-2014d]AIX15478.1 hypothetical protein Syn7803C49_2 [Synechococcus phage ACG-2014d]AIX15907.1 hypothetical protein Syn7803C54_2 [Synechococcus phage A